MIKFCVAKINELINEKELPQAILSFGMERKNEILNKTNLKKRMESAAATILMNRLLKESGFLPDEIIKDETGAPKFVIQTKLYCSITHSFDFVACAISDMPIGIDIQKMKEDDRTVFVNRFFCEKERNYVINSSENATKNFYQIWTSKESYLKMMRIGLRNDLQSLYTDLEHGKILDMQTLERGSLKFVESKDYMFCICTKE